MNKYAISRIRKRGPWNHTARPDAALLSCSGTCTCVPWPCHVLLQLSSAGEAQHPHYHVLPRAVQSPSHLEKELLLSSVSPDVRSGPVPAAQHTAPSCCVSQGLLRLASPASNISPAAPAQLHQCPADTGAVVQQGLGAVGSFTSSWLPAETFVSVSHLVINAHGGAGGLITPHVHGKTWAQQFWDTRPWSSP